jgi:pyridoxine 4-dehydrogenase
VRHFGLSNATPAQIAAARQTAPIVCVQNHYPSRIEPMMHL